MVFEATGAYHRALAEALEHAGLLYCKVNPRQARRFSQALGRRAKTDRIDAAMLARMGQVLELEPQAPRGETQSDLNALSSGRQALVKGEAPRSWRSGRPRRMRSCAARSSGA